MLKDIIQNFEEIRSEAKAGAINLERTLSDASTMLDNFGMEVTNKINTFLEDLNSYLEGIRTNIQESDLYNNLQGSTINFPELITIPKTSSIEEFSALIQGKFTSLEPFAQAILKNPDKGTETINHINSIVAIALEEDPNQGEELEDSSDFSDKILWRQSQLERMREPMSALINLILPTEIFEENELVHEVISKFDKFGGLVQDTPSDAFAEGVLYVAGKRFVINLVSSDRLINHNPTVSYILDSGDAATVTLEDQKLSIQLGSPSSPTTVGELKIKLEELSEISQVSTSHDLLDTLISRFPEERNMIAYSNWASSKAAAVKNEVSSIDTLEIPSVELSPTLKEIRDSVRNTLSGVSDGDFQAVDLIAILNTTFSKLLPTREVLVVKIANFISGLLNEANTTQEYVIDSLSEIITSEFPEYKSDITFFVNLINALRTINTSENVASQLIAIMDGEVFEGRTLTFIGLDFLNIIKNILYVVKFVENNEISISFKEYPQAAAKPESESESPSSSSGGSTLGNSSDTANIQSSVNQEKTTSTGNSANTANEQSYESQEKTSTLDDNINQIIEALPLELQSIARHFKNGTLGEYLTGDSLEDLTGQLETITDQFHAVFENDPYPSVNETIDAFMNLALQFICTLSQLSKNDEEAQNVGIIQKVVSIPTLVPKLILELLLNHISLPDWLVKVLMGEEDTAEPTIHPVCLLLSMPSAVLKKLFEIAKTKIQEEPQTA